MKTLRAGAAGGRYGGESFFRSLVVLGFLFEFPSIGGNPMTDANASLLQNRSRPLHYALLLKEGLLKRA
ncbi:hypothetical protein [Paenibacillus amylolyticus]|uniref:hypothetical protein n=1 Tax=Paenibacillus amylolyticus TaxID=1451 RepID=UPI003EBF76A9